MKCCDEYIRGIQEKSLRYNMIMRRYYINVDKRFMRQIRFCPWCGKLFANDLSEKWWDVLEEEYGITDPRNDDKHRVPPEFKTDEWWRKREL